MVLIALYLSSIFCNKQNNTEILPEFRDYKFNHAIHPRYFVSYAKSINILFCREGAQGAISPIQPNHFFLLFCRKIHANVLM